MSKVEVSVTPAVSSHVVSPAHPAMSVLPASEATQEEVGTLRARPSGSPAAQSSDSPASGGPLGSPLLGLRAGSEAMTPLAFRNHVLDVSPLDQGLVWQHTQTRARLVSERDSFSEEVASLSREFEILKAEMDELQARVASLRSCRDSSWEVLHQRSRDVKVANLANSTAQEISCLREEKQVMVRRAEKLKAMIEESLDLF
ncbi:hypothetical protein AMTR_s00120p00066970 [Amborella trichopoda]|uniref:Uncharacterized protein n=1 Tax=Amborella trichopoda TaxID=13333 RepID=W1NQH1_AMBTC|nr:hypothetical protein AMTR_s00120p00066970 [Amborella trichopoda]